MAAWFSGNHSLSIAMVSKSGDKFAVLTEADWESRVTSVTTRSRQVFSARPGYSGEWLCTPNPGLEGCTPLEALSTDSGYRAVQDLLAKMERGMYA